MRKESQVKSKLRPNSILFNAYPPERYKIESGSKRKVFVRFGIEKDNIDGQLIKQVGVNCSLNPTKGVLL